MKALMRSTAPISIELNASFVEAAAILGAAAGYHYASARAPIAAPPVEESSTMSRRKRKDATLLSDATQAGVISRSSQYQHAAELYIVRRGIILCHCRTKLKRRLHQ